jgi:RNA polymerase subunit RPABC4/transcription elongation factor Spt4
MVAADTASLLVIALVVVIVYIVVLWMALAFYVVRDARQRSTSASFVLFAALVGFFPPFLGPLVYFVIRPPHTIEEDRALALEEQALLEPAVDGVIVRPCPTCGREIEREFIVCPYCRTQFARRCGNCDRSLRLGWSVCPYCATEVGAHALTRVGR